MLFTRKRIWKKKLWVSYFNNEFINTVFRRKKYYLNIVNLYFSRYYEKNLNDFNFIHNNGEKVNWTEVVLMLRKVWQICT